MSPKAELQEMFKNVYRKSMTMILFLSAEFIPREGRVRFVLQQIKRCWKHLRVEQNPWNGCLSSSTPSSPHSFSWPLIVANLLYPKKFRTPNYEYGFANTKTRYREFLKIIFLGLDEMLTGLGETLHGGNSLWAKPAASLTNAAFTLCYVSFKCVVN